MTAGSDPEFIDTNVLLYSVDRGAGTKREIALELISSVPRLAVSIQVLQEFFVNATRRLTPPLPHAAAVEVIADVGSWIVHEPTVADVMAAMMIHERHTISFWDSMIVRSASALGCAVLWTEDLGHGATYAGVEARNPFA